MKRYFCLLILVTFVDVTFSVPTVSAAKRFLDCLEPYGFVNASAYFDSRQVSGVVMDQLLMAPQQFIPDAIGNDVAAHPQLSASAVLTRAGVKIHGPDIFESYKMMGDIAADFFGTFQETSFLSLIDVERANAYRLRAAYLRFDSHYHAEYILAGYHDHLLYIEDCSPQTVSYNEGLPIDLYSRYFQLRYTRQFSNFELGLSASTQFDFRSLGFVGENTSYIRNALVPDLTANLRFNFNDHSLGTTIDYKRLIPRLSSGLNLKVNESINSGIIQAYYKYQTEEIGFRTKVIFAQNAHDQTMISGYGVASECPATGKFTYTNIAAFSYWADFDYTFCRNSIKLNPGLFVGITKNLGSDKPLLADPIDGKFIVFSNFATIDYIFRVSPRLFIRKDAFVLGIELETTGAAYGTINQMALIDNPVPVTNFRILLSGYFYF